MVALVISIAVSKSSGRQMLHVSQRGSNATIKVRMTFDSSNGTNHS